MLLRRDGLAVHDFYASWLLRRRTVLSAAPPGAYTMQACANEQIRGSTGIFRVHNWPATLRPVLLRHALVRRVSARPGGVGRHCSGAGRVRHDVS